MKEFRRRHVSRNGKSSGKTGPLCCTTVLIEVKSPAEFKRAWDYYNGWRPSPPTRFFVSGGECVSTGEE